MEHRETDHIPYVLPIHEEVAERLDEHYGRPRWRDLKDNSIAVVNITRTFEFESEGGTARDVFGTLWRTDKQPAHLQEPAIPEPDLSAFRLPELDRIFVEDWLESGRRQCQRYHRDGKFVIAVLGYCLFERSWTLRGFENALMDMVAQREFYEELLDRITRMNLGIIDRFLQLPLDGIQTGDDWGDQRGVIMGKDRWRELFLPRYARIWGKVKSAGLFASHHSCGNISEIIGEAADAGLDCFESVQPEAMDPYALKERYGERMAFWGALGTQQLLPHGTPERIRSEVGKLCEVMGRGGGYILAPAKPVMEDVPTENAAALLEACLQQAGVSL